MAYLELNDHKLFYKTLTKEGAPWLIFSHSLGCSHEMWQFQYKALSPFFNILLYDTRGHGGSETTSTSFEIADLGQDIIHLMDHLKISKAHFCGLSLGGMIGMWLGVNCSDRFEKIILANTAAYMGGAEFWQSRIKLAKEQGMAAIQNSVLERWFTPEFKEYHSDLIQPISDQLLRTSPEGYIGCCQAISEMNQLEQIAKIKNETLIIAGQQDIATPIDQAIILQQSIKGAVLEVLSPASHLSNIEQAINFTHVLINFLNNEFANSVYQKGMKIRREVLGNEHVDRAEANKNEFTAIFQEYITRMAWGEIWSREGIDRRTRSFMTLVMMIALNRGDEFEMHVKAAFNNGLTKTDIMEAILHSAVYCGLPAANTALHLAQNVFNKLEEKP